NPCPNPSPPSTSTFLGNPACPSIPCNIPPRCDGTVLSTSTGCSRVHCSHCPPHSIFCPSINCTHPPPPNPPPHLLIPRSPPPPPASCTSTSFTPLLPNCLRCLSTGPAGSNGTYTPPALSIPSSASTTSTPFARHTPTRSPCSTPCSSSHRASWFARPLSCS